MTLSSVSTSYLNTALLPAVRSAQSQLANLEVESTTGEYADLGLQLGAQNGYELSLRSQDDLLQTMTTANGVTSTNLTAAQSALTTIQSAAQSTASTLLTWTPGSVGNSTLQSYGQTGLSQLISLGNTSNANGYLFGGENSAVQPLDDFYAQPTSAAKTSLDSAFQSYFGFSTSSPQVANITSAQMDDFLTNSLPAEFEDPSWSTNWSSASSVNSTAQIAPGQTVETSATASSAGFQQLAQGYAMLSEFGNIGLNSDASQTLANVAVSVINKGSNSITNQQSAIGLVQSQITQADDNMQSQMQLMQQEINRSDSVDAATVATELTTLTTQLQAAYTLTSKLNSMNLAQYLPT
jgi:flagellar hook-associated protein 3 FlgL